MRTLLYPELAVLIRKLRNVLLNRKIYDVFSYRDFFILKLDSKNDKRYFFMNPGCCLFVSNTILEKSRTDLTRKLARLLNRKNIINILVLPSERIIRIDFDNFYLFLEVFPRGNLVLTDIDMNILLAKEYKNYGWRKIFVGEKYVYREKEDWIRDINKIRDIILNSDKRDIVRCLAIDLNLGGKYAEWVLSNCNIPKDVKPYNLNDDQVNCIAEKIEQLLQFDNVKKIDTDFVLSDDGENILDFLPKFYLGYLKQKVNEEKEKIIRDQIAKMKELEAEIQRNRDIGEFILTNYELFDYILKNIDKKDLKSIIKEIKSRFGYDVDIERKNKNILVRIKL